VNLKRHVVRKNGKQHVYYSLSETIRINKNRTVQRRVLNLGELNTTQTEQWQRSIEVANHPQIEVKRIERDGELYVLTCSPAVWLKPKKSGPMHQRVLKACAKIWPNSVTRSAADGFALNPTLQQLAIFHTQFDSTRCH